MSFKNINDEDIIYCEQEIQKIGIAIERELNESAEMNCETDTDYLIKTFGKNFAENPSQFQFLRGELKLIKEIVDHVKTIVDGNGTNTGLNRFKYKEKRKRSRKTSIKRPTQSDTQSNTPSNDVVNKMTNTITNHGPNELKVTLFDKIKKCLMDYQADLDVEQLRDNIVDVEIEQSKIIGKIVCAVCKKSKNKPKRVYYDDITKNWCITNFQTHLKRSHGLISATPKSKMQKHDDEDDNYDDDVGHSSKIKTSIKDTSTAVSICSSNNEFDVECTDDLPKTERNADKIENQRNWLYNQMASQINSMMQAVLMNGENVESMEFEYDENMFYLNIVNISGDGNCLFATVAHQLWKCVVNSAHHIEMMNRLRSEVVEYILQNMPSFVHVLKNRIYEFKKASEISDIATECKMYVRHILSRNGQYGGYESVKALSELYKVNIITFYEGESCYIEPKQNVYDDTIAIAYRLSGNINYPEDRNHYDSVCDMRSECMLAVVDIIINKRLNRPQM